MKIMFFGDNFNGPTGYARQAREFVKRFKKEEYDELYYIGQGYGLDPTEIVTKEDNVTFLDIVPPMGGDPYLQRIMAYVNYYKPDVFFIIGNGIVSTTMNGLHRIPWKKSFPDMKLIYYSFNEGEYLQTTEKEIYDICDVVIPSSKFSKHQLEREGIKCIEHVYPGIDKETFKPLFDREKALDKTTEDYKIKKKLREKYGYKVDDKVVFSYSRVSPRKNIKNLLSAAYELKRVKFLFHFLELNPMPQYDMADFLERICPLKHGKRDWEENIKFTDKEVPTEELVEMINIADLALFPSKGEGFGFCPIECLFAGTPVMVSNNSTMPEIFNTVNTNYSIQMKCNLYEEMPYNCYVKSPDDKLIFKYVNDFTFPTKIENNIKFWNTKALEFGLKKEFLWDTWYTKLMNEIRK